MTKIHEGQMRFQWLRLPPPIGPSRGDIVLAIVIFVSVLFLGLVT